MPEPGIALNKWTGSSGAQSRANSRRAQATSQRQSSGAVSSVPRGLSAGLPPAQRALAPGPSRGGGGGSTPAAFQGVGGEVGAAPSGIMRAVRNLAAQNSTLPQQQSFGDIPRGLSAGLANNSGLAPAVTQPAFQGVGAGIGLPVQSTPFSQLQAGAFTPAVSLDDDDRRFQQGALGAQFEASLSGLPTIEEAAERIGPSSTNPFQFARGPDGLLTSMSNPITGNPMVPPIRGAGPTFGLSEQDFVGLTVDDVLAGALGGDVAILVRNLDSENQQILVNAAAVGERPDPVRAFNELSADMTAGVVEDDCGCIGVSVEGSGGNTCHPKLP